MLEGPLVFVDVDTQIDFLEPEGTLYIPGTKALHANLARLTDHARRHGIPILATACAHTEEDEAEIARFGRHCMVGTAGQARIEATRWDGGHVLGPSDSLGGAANPPEGLPPHLTLEKRSYDVFSHPDADRVVAAYNRNQPTFVVYGVATDFCVRAAVLGLLARGCKVAIVTDAIQAIDAAHEGEVLEEFVNAGGVLTLLDVVCDP